MSHFKFKFFGKSDDLHENGFKNGNFILQKLAKQIRIRNSSNARKSDLPTVILTF